MAESDVGSMGVKALRGLISSAGLSYADCFEKSDLQQRAREAQIRLASASRPSTGTQTDTQEMTLGGYPCIVIGCPEIISGTTQPDLCVLMLHGFGATNSDFVNLPALGSHMQKSILWVLPQAPIGSAGVSAWWELDPMKWMSAVTQGEAGIASLIREEPAGLQCCRSNMIALIDELSARFGGLPVSQLILAGFSQGAMTVMDLALHLPPDKAVAGVTVISGAPIVVEEWNQKLRHHKGIKVFITHGSSDMVLPFNASGWNKQLLENGGADVTYKTHAGGHTLPPEIIPDIFRFWSSL